MKQKEWIETLLLALGELSDINAQRRAWLGDEFPSFPAPDELLCQIFDDSGLDDLLQKGRLFSPAIDDLLMDMSQLAGGVNVKLIPEELLCNSKWLELAVKASDAKRQIQEIMK